MKASDFEAELTALIVRYPTVFRTNTPPDVLASVAYRAIASFEDGLLARSAHPFYRPGLVNTSGHECGQCHALPGERHTHDVP